MQYFAKQYEVAVIGAGHAGIEAGLASARLGCSTIVFTINLDWIGNMPCNPSIGGTSKGHLVREIDALGGEMGKAADKTEIQSRMLNRGKGPAVHSLRAQIDRREYSKYMKHALEKQENLDVKQAEIVDLTRDDQGLWHLFTRLEAEYTAKCVVLATGTFLGGRVYIPQPRFPRRFINFKSPCAALKPARPRASIAAASTFRFWKCKKVTKRPCRFLSTPKPRPKTRRIAISLTPTKKPNV